MDKTIGQILIEKLTKEELRELCSVYDDGRLNEIMFEEIIPIDMVNYPPNYADDTCNLNDDCDHDCDACHFSDDCNNYGI